MVKLSRRQKECRSVAIGHEMSLFKSRKLRSSSGQLVRNPKQAIAIAISVANRKCLSKKVRTALAKERALKLKKKTSIRKATKRIRKTKRKRTKKSTM